MQLIELYLPSLTYYNNNNNNNNNYYNNNNLVYVKMK